MGTLKSVLFAVACAVVIAVAGLNGIAEAATCSTCHDMPPLDATYRNITTGAFQGNHQTHQPASAAAMNCSICHTDSVISYPTNHRNGSIEVSKKLKNYSAAGKGRAGYNQSRPYQVSTNAIFFNQSSLPVQNSCSNVNCHFESITPNWGTTTLFASPGDCSQCHSASPATYSHNRHIEKYGNNLTACAKCHPDHTVAAKPFQHATSAGNAGRNIQLTVGAYDGSNFQYLPSQSGSRTVGTCSATYCHSSGKKGLSGMVSTDEPVSPSWSGAALDCKSCHGASSTAGSFASQYGEPNYANAGAEAAGANSHLKHVPTGAGAAVCAKCHQKTTTTGTTLIAGNQHTDKFNNYTSNTGATFGKLANKTCSNISCHSGGGIVVGVSNAQWGATLTCTGCHGDDTVGTLSTNHAGHVNNTAVLGTNYGCVDCHSSTVSNNTTVSTPASHLNSFVNLSSNSGRLPRYSGAFSAAYSCSASYCHSDGKGAYKTIAWNAAAIDCKGCHGSAAAPAFTSQYGEPNSANAGAGVAGANSHQKHVPTGAGAAVCAKCHQKTTTTGTTLIAGNQHTDKFNNYTSNTGATFGKLANKTCSNISCHSGGSAQWGATLNCESCHPRSTLSGAHQYHIDNSTAAPAVYLNLTSNTSVGSKHNYGCSVCHPLSNSSHANGTIVIDFRPAITNPGSLRAKNSSGINQQSSAINGVAYSGTVATTGISGTAGSSVVCNNVYCHSNGGNSGGSVLTTTTYYASPNWYGTITGTQDKCSMCHGNSPNSSGSWGTRVGSPAHYNTSWLGYTNVSSGHSLGFHDKNIYKGGNLNGLVNKSSGSPSAHGNPALATTFNCNACHYMTVTTAANDKNNVCVKCHYSGGSASVKNPANDMQLIANTAFHVNGTLNITFKNMTGYVIPAQVRDSSYLNYSSSWRRQDGYKTTNSAEHWNPKTTPSYSGGTCSNIACHNSQSVKWGDTGGTTSCQSCHTDL